MRANSRQQKAAIAIVAAVAVAIRDLGSVPAGHLYATVMGQMTLAEFEQVIAYIIESDLATRDASHLLTWTGPAKA